VKLEGAAAGSSMGINVRLKLTYRKRKAKTQNINAAHPSALEKRKYEVLPCTAWQREGSHLGGSEHLHPSMGLKGGLAEKKRRGLLLENINGILKWHGLAMEMTSAKKLNQYLAGLQ